MNATALTDRRARTALLAKMAGLGGAGNDAEFESAFANLAHAYIKDKSPNLLKYEVGFQMVERRDDDRAVGIAGFLVGDRWLYVPILYVNGQMKGQELLYLKDQDLFVPLKENWVESILNRQTRDLGTAVLRNPRLHSLNPPEVNAWRRSYKYSSSWPDEVREAASRMARALQHQSATTTTTTKQATLMDLMETAGREAWAALQRDLDRYPLLRPKLAAHYDLAALEKAAAAVVRPGDLLAQGPDIDCGILGPVKQAVRVYDGRESQLVSSSDLSASDREKLIRDGFAIDDQRQHAADVYRVAVRSPGILTSPTSTGVYEVMSKEGGFVRCLVVVNPWSHEGPALGRCLLVDIDRPQRHFLADSKLVLARPEEKLLDYLDLFLGLPDAATITKEPADPKDPYREGVRHILLGPLGQGTCPFSVRDVLDADGGGKLVRGYFDTYARYEISSGPLRNRFTRFSPTPVSWPDRVIRIGGHRGRVTVLDDELMIPDGFHRFELGRADTNEQRNWFPLGTYADLERFLYSKTAALTVQHQGDTVRINDREMATRRAVPHLVTEFNLREVAAREVLGVALKEKRAEFRVKPAAYPAGPYLPQNTSAAPGFPEPPRGSFGGRRPVPYAEPQQDILSVVGDRPASPYIYPYGDDQGEQGLNLGGVMHALQTGRQEILDTAMVGRLLRAVRDENIIDKFIPRLMSGLDALARILLGIYWHREKYEDRFGKADMPALEDAVRNTFESVGDVVLQLKEDRTGETSTDLLAADVKDVAET